MRIKTSDLSGMALDWAVFEVEYGTKTFEFPDSYRPSIDWMQGGPIIERMGISIDYTGWGGNEGWVANYDHDTDWQGHTPLVAAMRCYVASKLGNEVEIPDELRGVV